MKALIFVHMSGNIILNIFLLKRKPNSATNSDTLLNGLPDVRFSFLQKSFKKVFLPFTSSDAG